MTEEEHTSLGIPVLLLDVSVIVNVEMSRMDAAMKTEIIILSLRSSLLLRILEGKELIGYRWTRCISLCDGALCHLCDNLTSNPTSPSLTPPPPPYFHLTDSQRYLFHCCVSDDENVHVLPSGNLVMTNITSGHGTGDYSCVAVNPVTGHNTTSPRKISVHVGRGSSAVKLMPGMKRKVQVEMGSDVSLECPSYGHPSGNITWSKIGGSLPIGRFNLTEFGNINIASVQYEDTGTYRCQGSTGSDQVVLEIFTIPVVQVVRQPGKSVHVGDRVEFVCSYGGLPKPSLRWYHNGRELSSSSEGNLVLTKVTAADSGIYQCMASSVFGTRYGVLSLMVNPHPRVVKPTVSLPKESDEVTDKKTNNDKINKGRQDRKKNGRRKNVSMRDKRKKKKLGKGHQVDTEKPKYAPSVPTVTQLSDRSVMLNWSVPDPGNGQTIKFFKIQYREMSSEKSIWHTSDAHLSPDSRKFEVVNLKLGASYKFRILAVYEDDDNKNSPSTNIFRLKIEPYKEIRTPDTSPVIVETTPIVYQETYGMGVRWQ
ncbi:hypothetical protein Btru_062955, partial [Bulinus truncatus]